MAESGWYAVTKTVSFGERCGLVSAPSSKSQAHRFLICAALSKNPCRIYCSGISRDILATAKCLEALGAKINMNGDMILVEPIRRKGEKNCVLPCAESGSTLRFMLPIAGALGDEARFIMEGRLPQRPMTQYERALCGGGMTIKREGGILFCEGKLRAGEYVLPGNVSSQYVSGLLMALPLICGDSVICIEGSLESVDYVEMTLAALKLSGIEINRDHGDFYIAGGQTYDMPDTVCVEGDYSSAAFFLCAGALSYKGVRVTNLSADSKQGDRRVAEVLRAFGAEVREGKDYIEVKRAKLCAQTIDASMIPDLVPILSVVAAVSEGETRIVHAQRLRMKESDRLESTSRMLTAIGADAEQTEDGLLIRGGHTLSGGTVDPMGDHRIAMSGAIAAGACEGDVTVCDAECVEKSYPRFWEDLEALEVKR